VTKVKADRAELTGRHVLVTRPVAQAESLISAINDAGGKPITLPLIDIVSLEDEPTSRQKIIDLDNYDLVIATSINAARPGVALIDRYWPQVPSHIFWFAIGGATAAVFDAYGLAVKVPDVGASSEALLQLDELQSVSGQRILLMKGEKGRDQLFKQLSERGARVDILELYRREQVKYTSAQLAARLQGGLPDVLIAASVETVLILEVSLGSVISGLKQLPLIVASKRIAEVAHQHGYQRVTIADGASTRSIMAALNVIAYP